MTNADKETFRHVRSGDDARPMSARTFNAVIDAARDRDQAGMLPREGPPRELFDLLATSTVVRIYNNTGAALIQSGIAAVNQSVPVVDDAASLATLQEFPIIKAIAVSLGTNPTPTIVITTEPIGVNALGQAALVGAAVVQINVTDATHGYATATSDAAKLTSAVGGSTKILWKQTGTGTKWAIVELLDTWLLSVDGTRPVFSIVTDSTTGITSVNGSTATERKLQNIDAGVSQKGVINTGSQSMTGPKTWSHTSTFQDTNAGGSVGIPVTMSIVGSVASPLYFGCQGIETGSPGAQTGRWMFGFTSTNSPIGAADSLCGWEIKKDSSDNGLFIFNSVNTGTAAYAIGVGGTVTYTGGSAAVTVAGTTLTFHGGLFISSSGGGGLIPVSGGGTGVGTLLTHGLVVGEGTSAVNVITGTAGQLVVAQAGADPSFVTVSGSGLLNAAGVLRVPGADSALHAGLGGL